MGDIYTRICKDCKKTFKSDKPAAQYCPECKAEHRQKTWDNCQIAGNIHDHPDLFEVKA